MSSDVDVYKNLSDEDLLILAHTFRCQGNINGLVSIRDIQNKRSYGSLREKFVISNGFKNGGTVSEDQ